MTIFYYTMSEEDLILLISKNDDQYALKELINRYKKKATSLAFDMCQTNPNSGIAVEELKLVAFDTIYESAKQIKDRQIKFSTYWISSTKRNMIAYITKHSYNNGAQAFNGFSLSAPTSQNNNLELEEVVGEEDKTNETVMENEILTFLKESSLFSKQEIKVFTLYIQGYSFEEIAKIEGRCLSAIYKTIDKTRKKLQESIGARYFIKK